MEGKNQITIKDWVEHLHWVIDNIESRKNHYEKFRIPLLTLLILSIPSFITSIINFQWIFTFFSFMGILFSAFMLTFTNKKSGQCDTLSNEVAMLLNNILLQDNVEIDNIRIVFLEISSKRGPLDENMQKRLEELKIKKRKKN